uniref:Peptide N-acetyl-beta-D-glucosaminyl asparaginase amidase A N-terminal domain-containing protein n=1 Tax=Fagus sylvatica TaxID=28930 RepID=A0A2N9ITB4_FAGSY
MSIFLSLLLLFFTVPVSPSHTPDRYTKSLPSFHHKPREYFELAPPLPSDFLVPSCSRQILRHSFANTINSPPFSIRSSPPSDCPSPWSHVALEFRAECRGEQYDRIAGLWLGGAELLRTSTAEPTKCGIFWKVRKDITRYSSLLSRYDLNLTMMLENIVNRVSTGVYHVTVNFLYYKYNTVKLPSMIPDPKLYRVNTGQGLEGLYEPPADFIIPISDRGDKGFWFRIDGESDFHSKSIPIPRNTYRAVLECMLVNKKVHRIGFGVSEGISYWLVNANLHVWVDHKSRKVQAKPVVYNTPRLKIKRKEDFKLLDGSFKVEAERKAVFVGWVKSSLGNFTTVFSLNYKLKNSLSFQNNGAYKLVKQKIKATREVKVLNDLGAVISRVGVRRRYPFVVITLTLPGPEEEEEYDSDGWMLVKDHSVLSGAATTRQSFSYRDDFRCYSRTVKASDGKLISDDTTPACFSSV